ncbi:MAG: ATP synthase F1 subunit gamma [Acidimicrobiales bacterium]
MAGSQERVLRRRIRSIQSTKKITRAMELIAASQLVKSQGRIRAAAPYQSGMARVLAEVAADSPTGGGRLMGVPESPQRVLVLALVADRGLCGGYNSGVLRTTERLLRAGRQDGIEYSLMTVGRKAISYFRFRNQELTQSFTGFSDRPSFEDARQVAEAVVEPFRSGAVDQVMIVSTRFLSAGSQVVETRQVLPLPEASGAGAVGSGSDETYRAVPGMGSSNADLVEAEGATRAGYTEFEPDSTEMLDVLVPRYAGAVVFGALLEAAASELTARQRAMAAATENADELIKTLARVMNRARQEAITTEIMEIVGGAEALKG